MTDGFKFPKPGPRRPPMKPGQQRRKRINAKRATARRTSFVRDEQWKADVRQLACVVHIDPHDCRWPPGVEHRCDPSHIDHALGKDRRGLGQKTDDTRTVPMCRMAHDAYEFGTGIFKGATKEQRRTWGEVWLQKTEKAVEELRKARAA